MSTTSQQLVAGQSSPEFAEVRDALERNIRAGEEAGAALVVDIDGTRVIDLWGGYRDAERTSPWEADTVVNVWSMTKPVVALAILILVNRGLLDLDKPVAAYWPEFAAAGKGDVRLRHLLAHASGVSGLEAPAVAEDLYDADGAAARMAAQAPWWKPGTASGYHLFNYGHLLGEVIRRVTGKTLTAFVADEIAVPLGADFRIGAAGVSRSRIAEIVPPPPLPFDVEDLDHDTAAYKTFTGPALDAAIANTEGWRGAEIGAANGHGNARSLAQILSVIARGGTVDGHRLLDQSVAEQMLEEQVAGMDLVNGLYLRWGLGLALSDTRTLPWIPEGRIGYWGGWGGSIAIIDFDRRMTICYAMNRMGSDILASERSQQYVEAIYRALGTRP